MATCWPSTTAIFAIGSRKGCNRRNPDACSPIAGRALSASGRSLITGRVGWQFYAGTSRASVSHSGFEQQGRGGCALDISAVPLGTGCYWECISVGRRLRADNGSTGIRGMGDFIVRHSQRLTQHPNMLVALVQLEGFASARQQVSSRQWRHPWLRSWEEPTPPGRPAPPGLHLEIKADKQVRSGRVSAVACQARLIFSVERLGSIEIIDYRDMQELLTRVAIGSGRPVKIASAGREQSDRGSGAGRSGTVPVHARSGRAPSGLGVGSALSLLPT